MPGQRAVSGGVDAALPADWLVPDWPAPAGVQALCTTRAGGVSQGPYASMNLGTHVGDDPQAVQTNRARLQAALGQSTPGARPVFLSQVHGTGVAALTASTPDNTEADTCVATDAGVVCTIMVADCLPILIAHRELKIIGAAHAGWRGLAGQQGVGVVERLWQAYCRLVEQQQATPHAAIAAATQVWLGPCIGPQAFEVGEEVVRAFTQAKAQAEACFLPGAAPGKWQADLAALARQRWQALGIDAIYGNDSSTGWCTVANPSRFFSHRRDSGIFGSTGRMAAAIVRTV